MTDEELDTFLALPRSEQKKVLDRLKRAPQFLTVLHRRLREGVTYEQFEEAWIPTELPHYQGTVQAINAVRKDSSNEVLSIGIISESWSHLMEEAVRTASLDEARGDRIDSVAERDERVEIYEVKRIIDLGT